MLISCGILLIKLQLLVAETWSDFNLEAKERNIAVNRNKTRYSKNKLSNTTSVLAQYQ